MTTIEINTAIKRLESANTHYELAVRDTTIAILALRSISMEGKNGSTKKKSAATPEEIAKFKAKLHQKMFKKSPAKN